VTSPAVQVRDRLIAARARGLTFDAAWRISMVGIDWPSGGEGRQMWLTAFVETAEEWRAAFDLAPGRATCLRGLDSVLDAA